MCVCWFAPVELVCGGALMHFTEPLLMQVLHGEQGVIGTEHFTKVRLTAY
jgi:hypothetical protein